MKRAIMKDMKDKSIGFIGGGRIARIFLGGWNRAGKLPADITVSDPDPGVLGALKSRFPSIATAPGNAAAAGHDIVFVAVHPPAVADAVSAIGGSFKDRALVVSLAPKFTIAKLGDLLGGFARIARVIPNAPSLMGLGFNPVAFGAALAADDRTEVKALLSPLGECPEVEEEKLEAYAVLSAMGPTFFWFQLQTLREIIGGFGLKDDEIAAAMKRMVCGGTRTLLESGLTPAEVIDLIPRKPLGEMEPQVTEMYRTRLPAVYQTIKP